MKKNILNKLNNSNVEIINLPLMDMLINSPCKKITRDMIKYYFSKQNEIYENLDFDYKLYYDYFLLPYPAALYKSVR